MNGRYGPGQRRVITVGFVMLQRYGVETTLSSPRRLANRHAITLHCRYRARSARRSNATRLSRYGLKTTSRSILDEDIGRWALRSVPYRARHDTPPRGPKRDPNAGNPLADLAPMASASPADD